MANAMPVIRNVIQLVVFVYSYASIRIFPFRFKIICNLGTTIGAKYREDTNRQVGKQTGIGTKLTKQIDSCPLILSPTCGNPFSKYLFMQQPLSSGS